MRALVNLNGVWDPSISSIRFSWDPSSLENDRFVFIYAIKNIDGNLSVDYTYQIVHDIQTSYVSGAGGVIMKIQNAPFGVSKMTFCGFSDEKGGVPGIEEILMGCKAAPKSLTEVLMGCADIVYSIKASAHGNAKLINIELTSSCTVLNGVLGYRYFCDNGFPITFAFPNAIQKGKNVYPPILIPQNSNIDVVAFDKQFTGNLRITRKNRFLGF